VARFDREEGAVERDVEAFFSDLIHDLRNLLDGVTMMLPRDSAASPELLLHEATFRNVYDILRKAEDFRDRSRPRADAGGSAELEPVVERALEDLRPFIRDREVELTRSGRTPVVTVNERALRKILENVLHVVSKRSVKRKPIHLSIEDGDDVVVALETPRLATETEARDLFSPSFKDGLDLWVSRETVRSVGGELTCTRDNDGLCVRVTLPKGGADGDEPPAPSNRRVLVVDDNPDSAKSLEILLSSAGFEVEVCTDGASALETVSSFGPEAVVLDLGLPDIDGYEVCRLLRRGPGGEQVLVLAVSGRDDRETYDAVDAAGIDELFVKPVDHRHLIRRLRE
jgi:CheY-like chemotaxis protein